MWHIYIFIVLSISKALGESKYAIETDPAGILQVEQNVSDVGREVSAGINNFTLELYKVLGEKEGNIFFSPMSAATSLAMLYYMTAGKTAEELASALHLPQGEETAAKGFMDVMTTVKQNGTLAMANKAFIDNWLPVKKEYIDLISKYFESEAMNLDYRKSELAREIINNWTSENTGGKIPELLPEGTISEDTKMVLVSTVHFKGIWHYEFKKNLTTEQDFFLADGTTVKVPMMVRKSRFGYKDLWEYKAKVLHIPYKKGLQIFTIILPNKHDGLPELEKNLAKLDFQKQMLDTSWVIDVEAIIPKFKLEIAVEFNNHLKELGIQGVFGQNYTDFSKAVDKKGLYVSLVKHSACIEVDEKGTEAAAASAVVIGLRIGLSLNRLEFRADHPFVFLISDRLTKAILFAGRYSSPNS